MDFQTKTVQLLSGSHILRKTKPQFTSACDSADEASGYIMLVTASASRYTCVSEICLSLVLISFELNGARLRF